jgi:molybdopterin/thiamine biosynthesis adenylyltransferase/rhodanese-related sulfurtransferase
MKTESARVKRLTVEELAEAHARGEPMVLVDVRDDAERRAGSIPGSIGLPEARLEAEIAAHAPDRAARVVTYCATGPRAVAAAERLTLLGYEDVSVATPGFAAWRRLGFPIERAPSPLSDAQRDRYARHLLLPEVGDEGQAKLLASKVLLVGAGGLGSPVALYLAAAGVGTIGVVDADAVDASNLQRQVLHATSRLGLPKTESARRALSDLCPDVAVVAHAERIVKDNVERIVQPYDVVVDGADNFPTRYLLSDASVWLGKPLVHGSVARFEGQVTTFVPDAAAARFGVPAGPCYRCLFAEPPPAHLAPSCAEAGVLGVVPGTIGMLQATEVLKLLLGRGEPLVGRLLTYDSLATRFRELRFRRAPDCRVCGPSPTITDYVDYEAFCGGAG